MIWGVHDVTHSLYIDYISLNVSVLGLCLLINDSDLFAWISLAALSPTYFITYIYPYLDYLPVFGHIVLLCPI